MNEAIRLGQVRGITIRLHHTVLLFLLLLAAIWGLQVVPIYLFLLAPIVLLHELGHSVVAQHYGIRVLDITFWPLGGMARMSHIPEDSRIEGRIAIAGPLVNFALALVAAPLLLVPGLSPFVGMFVAVNLVLGLFNLLPAFPMDGGRVLRAWLGRKGDWLRATEQAVRVGRFVALLFVIVAFATLNPILGLIALFVWWAGGQELRQVRIRHEGPAAAFGPLFRMMFRGAMPGAMPGQGAPPREARAEPAEDPGPRRAPFEAAPRPPTTAAERRERAGWSEEELARLERFPGPMRQFPTD